MAEIAFIGEAQFREWLKDRPFEWAQVLALRSALRVAPLAIDPRFVPEQTLLAGLLVALQRASLLGWGLAKHVPSSRQLPWASLAAIDNARAESGYFAKFISERGAGIPIGAVRRNVNAEITTVTDALRASGFAVRHDDRVDAPFVIEMADSASGCNLAAQSARLGLSQVNGDSASDHASGSIWVALSIDAGRLDNFEDPQELIGEQLWQHQPDWFIESWQRARDAIRELQPQGSFSSWFERRISGRKDGYSFRDDGEVEFLDRLIESNNKWWDRGPTAVDHDLAEWLRELAPSNEPPSYSELEQNPNVVNFTIDEDGQVALAPEPLPNGLQSDQDSRDNHAELRRLLQNGLDASQPGLTQATDVANSAEPCLDALGLSVEEVKPRLLVLRGRELVRQIESRLNESSMLPPLSQAQQDAFLPWKDAFEMFVALDPRLSSLWNARFDAADETLTTGQVRLIADAIRESGVARDEAVEIVESSVAGVEPGADEADPARRTASEIAKNVFRAMGRAYRGVENAIKTSERVVKLVEKVAHLHAKISPHLPEGDAIRRILDWILGP